MTDFDIYFESRINAYYTEMKTRKEYAKQKFKKKYDYDPKTKTIKDSDGRRIEVDMDTKKPKMKVTEIGGKTHEKERTTGADLNSKNPRINLDKNFFKLKGQDRRDAALQHEIAHTRYHSVISSDNDTKSEYIGRKLIRDVLKDIIEQKKNKVPKSILVSVLQGSEMKNLTDDLIKKYMTGSISPETLKSQYRRSAYSKLEKYVPKNNTNKHTNATEFEADLYAANKTGKSNVKEAIRQSAKLVKKDVEKKYGKNSEELKKFNKENDSDIKIRSKVLNKNNLTDNEKNVYK